MRKNLIDAGRTYHNRLWTCLLPDEAFSLFRLLFDTVLHETLFSFDLVEFVLLFIQSPRLLFQQQCIGFVSRTFFQSALSAMYAVILIFLLFIFMIPGKVPRRSQWALG